MDISNCSEVIIGEVFLFLDHYLFLHLLDLLLEFLRFGGTSELALVIVINGAEFLHCLNVDWRTHSSRAFNRWEHWLGTGWGAKWIDWVEVHVLF